MKAREIDLSKRECLPRIYGREHKMGWGEKKKKEKDKEKKKKKNDNKRR